MSKGGGRINLAGRVDFWAHLNINAIKVSEGIEKILHAQRRTDVSYSNTEKAQCHCLR